MSRMHETIITQLGTFRRRSHRDRARLAALTRVIEGIEQGGDDRLEVRTGERGRTWVVHLGRTPLAAYSSASAVAAEVRAAIAGLDGES